MVEKGVTFAAQNRGVEQLVARRAHNPKVVGSSPASATKKKPRPFGRGFFVFGPAQGRHNRSFLPRPEKTGLVLKQHITKQKCQAISVLLKFIATTQTALSYTPFEWLRRGL